MELLHHVELVALGLFADALEHGGGEFIRRGSGEHDDGIVLGVFLLILLGNVPGDRRVRVAEVVVILPDLADGDLRALIVAEACPEELVQLFKHLGRHLVLTVFAELLHQIRDELVVAGEEIEQALQVTGDENVHRGGHCLVEGAAAVIAARAQEVGQHIVGVGRAHELADGKAHLLGKVAREDIAEVAGRHDVVDLVARLDAARLHEVGVRSIIIDDLRGEAANVDGVGRGQANALALEQLILADGGENFLHAGLRGSMESATSLKALVGPRKSSRMKSSPTGTVGGRWSVSNLPV